MAPQHIPTTTTTTAGSARAAAIERYLELQPAIRARVEASVAPELREEFAGVTRHQVQALTRLPEGGLPMRQLAELLHISSAAASVLADRLVAQGLAERGSDPTDRRIVRLVPTERGRALVAGTFAAQRQAADALFARLSDEQVGAFLDILEALAREDDRVLAEVAR